MKRLLLILTLLMFALSPSAGQAAEVTPLLQAHAHNDYEHARPLLDALDHGFCSVEADIYLIDGRLLVAHDREQVRPERTLESLYLEPLKKRARSNGGRIYRDGPAFSLLIDVKSDAEPAYQALRTVLARYSELLTRFRQGRVEPSAVTVVVSGNRARKLMEAETLRYAGVDGRLEDLDVPSPASLAPWISANWTNVFAWRGEGAMPDAERARLREIVRRAHEQGRKVRFWATPERPALWQELRAAGVDFINTDDLPRLRRFLASAVP